MTNICKGLELRSLFLSRLWVPYYWTFSHRIDIGTSISYLQMIYVLHDCFMEPFDFPDKTNKAQIEDFFLNYKADNLNQVVRPCYITSNVLKQWNSLSCLCVHLATEREVPSTESRWWEHPRDSHLHPFIEQYWLSSFVNGTDVAIFRKKSYRNKAIKCWKTAVRD